MNNMSFAEANHEGTSSDRHPSHQTNGLPGSAVGTVLTNGVGHLPPNFNLEDDEASTELPARNTHDSTAATDGAERLSRRPTVNDLPAIHSRDNSDGTSMIPPPSSQSSQDGSKPSYQHKVTLGERLHQSYIAATWLVPHEARVAAERAAASATMTGIAAVHGAVGWLPGPLGSMGHSMVNMTAGAVLGPQLALGGYLRSASLGWGAGRESARGDPSTYSSLYHFAPGSEGSEAMGWTTY